VDYAIEAAGQTNAVREGLKLVRTGGAYVSVGFGEPNDSVNIDCFDIVRRNLRYQGIWVSDTRHTFMSMQCIYNIPHCLQV
jgi:threonine dehydrogenase-like Zn-dependent dehydrogenase